MDAQYLQAARENVDRHLGDVIDSDSTQEEILDEVWHIAFDGARDAGASFDEAGIIANAVKAEFAQ